MLAQYVNLIINSLYLDIYSKNITCLPCANKTNIYIQTLKYWSFILFLDKI